MAITTRRKKDINYFLPILHFAVVSSAVEGGLLTQYLDVVQTNGLLLCPPFGFKSRLTNYILSCVHDIIQQAAICKSCK